MSVGLLRGGVEIDYPAKLYKKFSGLQILYRGFNPPTSPSNTALVVGLWEWGTRVDGGPWKWQTNTEHIQYKIATLTFILLHDSAL